MSIVRFEAAMVCGVYPRGDNRIEVSMDMSAKQRKAAVLILLGDMPDLEAAEFLRAMYPRWFATEVQK